jgi:hypothetical protein
MTSWKSPGAVGAVALGASTLALVVIPAAVSLASGSGAVCFVDSACPISPINPCVRKPTFALVGRCAVDIR